jgi:hypothetical protein
MVVVMLGSFMLNLERQSPGKPVLVHLSMRTPLVRPDFGGMDI